MSMPTEIIVMASLALTLLLVAGVWSVAVPKCDPSGALKADQTSGELTASFAFCNSSAMSFWMRWRSVSSLTVLRSSR